MNNKVLVVDLQYFSNYTYYKTLSQASYCHFDQYQNHLKKSFTNRCLIAGANGPITLSIPIDEGRNTKRIVKDIRISNAQNWQRIHWRSLVSGYSASPWFEYYAAELADIYSQKFTFLLEWNLVCFEWSRRILQIDLAYEWTTEYKAIYPEEGFTDLRHFVVPGKDQPDNGIRYQQVFGDRRPFIPGLSILDLLFCVGATKASKLLRGES